MISTASPGKIARAFSNYPPTEERIEKAQTAISTLLPDRNDYVLDTSEFQEVKARLTWADRPILRRHRGDEPSNGPVLRRHPSEEPEQTHVADTLPLVTKGKLRVCSTLCPMQVEAPGGECNYYTLRRYFVHNAKAVTNTRFGHYTIVFPEMNNTRI